MAQTQLITRGHAISWNRIQDEKDVEVWNRLANSHLLPDKCGSPV